MGLRVEVGDGHAMYLDAIREAFGFRIDYAQVVKEFEATGGPPWVRKRRFIGNPDPALVSTSLVERANLTMRTQMRRFTRKALGFSKTAENHAHSVDLHFMVNNFVVPHGTLTRRHGRPTTPAMEAGLERDPWTMMDVAERMDGSYRVAA